jgi:hypothetical protein
MKERLDTRYYQCLHSLSKFVQVEEDEKLDPSSLLCNAIWCPGKIQFVCGSGTFENLSSSTVFLQFSHAPYMSYSFDFAHVIKTCNFSQSLQPISTGAADLLMHDIEKLFWEECSNYKKDMNLLSIDLGVLIVPSICSFGGFNIFRDIVASRSKYSSIHR